MVSFFVVIAFFIYVDFLPRKAIPDIEVNYVACAKLNALKCRAART